MTTIPELSEESYAEIVTAWRARPRPSPYEEDVRLLSRLIFERLPTIGISIRRTEQD